MKSLRTVAVAALLGLATATRQVAIIGAGAAGASAAYHLRKEAADAGIPINITIFEKTNRIGGRAITINPYDDPLQPVEMGASIFVQLNKILFDAMREFNLEQAPDTTVDSSMGIWDGNSFVFVADDNLPDWVTYLAALKYGTDAPQRTENLVLATLGKFLRIYGPAFFPFRSLTQAVNDLDLVGETNVTAAQLLTANNINGPYASELIQASTRLNYASNLDNIHGLGAMVSLAAEGAMAIKGGNFRIFEKMVEASGATTARNTPVIGLDFHKPGGQASTPPRYSLRTNAPASPNSTYSVVFDKVIIANPYQFSEMSAAAGVLQHAIEQIPYVQLHVTIFTSAKRLSPGYFKWPIPRPKWWPFFWPWVQFNVPSFVLTTLAKTDNANSGTQGVGKAGFYTIETVQQVTNPHTGNKEFVYKIFSPEIVTPTLLSSLFGRAVPATFTGGSSPISWYHAHFFNPYPKLAPRTEFQGPVVGDGIYYTSGIESFISTMETSALMGRNVARLLVDDIRAAVSSTHKMVKNRGSRVRHA